MHLSTLLLGALAAFVALAVHELGHLLGGLLVGFRFSLYVIGPLKVERDATGRIRVGWNRTPSFFGGAAATVPRDLHALKRRFAAVVAAGPLASLVLAGAAALALAGLSGPHPFLRPLLGWLRLLSGLVFAGTAVPFWSGPFVTDGLRFLRIAGNGRHAGRELALITLAACEAGGVPPREWDGALIERGLQPRDGSIFECQIRLYAHLRARDAGDAAAADASLERLREVLPRVPASLRREFLAALKQAGSGASA